MKKLLKRIASFVRIGNREKDLKRQGGYVVITLAAVGLFGGIAAAAPVLNRAVSSLSASEASAAGQSGATSAAEHALWRLRNDPSLWSSMSGTPPTTTYTHDVLGSDVDATVDVTALTDPPEDELRAAIAVSPGVLPSGETGQFTYDLTVTNDSISSRQITQVTVKTFEANLLSLNWKPDAISGSVSGMTTDNPTRLCGWLLCKWVWYPSTSIDGFGGEATLTWTAEDSQSFGSYYAVAEIQFDNGETIVAPNSARLRFQTLNALDISESVTPSTNPAGSVSTYDYTLTVENNGPDQLTIEWLRHWSHDGLTYVPGSSYLDGSTIADPAPVHTGFLVEFLISLIGLGTLDDRDRYQWNVLPTEINPGETKVLTFQMQGGLEPGTYYSRASVLVEEAWGGIFADLDLSTSTSGESAPITTLQGFTVTAEHDGDIVEVTGHVTADGIEVLSWKES